MSDQITGSGIKKLLFFFFKEVRIYSWPSLTSSGDYLELHFFFLDRLDSKLTPLSKTKGLNFEYTLWKISDFSLIMIIFFKKCLEMTFNYFLFSHCCSGLQRKFRKKGLKFSGWTANCKTQRTMGILWLWWLFPTPSKKILPMNPHKNADTAVCLWIIFTESSERLQHVFSALSNEEVVGLLFP